MKDRTSKGAAYRDALSEALKATRLERKYTMNERAMKNRIALTFIYAADRQAIARGAKPASGTDGNNSQPQNQN